MACFGGHFSFGRVSMPSATMTCTVCSFAMRSISFQSVASSVKSAGSAGVPQSPALRSSRNCCCAKVIVGFMLCLAAVFRLGKDSVFFVCLLFFLYIC